MFTSIKALFFKHFFRYIFCAFRSINPSSIIVFLPRTMQSQQGSVNPVFYAISSFSLSSILFQFLISIKQFSTSSRPLLTSTSQIFCIIHTPANSILSQRILITLEVEHKTHLEGSKMIQCPGIAARCTIDSVHQCKKKQCCGSGLSLTQGSGSFNALTLNICKIKLCFNAEQGNRTMIWIF